MDFSCIFSFKTFGNGKNGFGNRICIPKSTRKTNRLKQKITPSVLEVEELAHQIQDTLHRSSLFSEEWITTFISILQTHGEHMLWWYQIQQQVTLLCQKGKRYDSVSPLDFFHFVCYLLSGLEPDDFGHLNDTTSTPISWNGPASVEDMEVDEKDNVFLSTVHCKRCNQQKVTVEEKQTRTGDEGFTCFFSCSACHFKWKQNT